nr:MAG TPA: hypothetical protein [Caudoviricetes sp.]
MRKVLVHFQELEESLLHQVKNKNRELNRI